MPLVSDSEVRIIVWQPVCEHPNKGTSC